MKYHIDTSLIIDKFNSRCDCPLCEIEKIVTEQFLTEFLNDAVMEDNTRISVGKKGFCDKHVDMLLNRQNKLSVALQLETRIDKTSKLFTPISSVKSAKKRAKDITNSLSKCVICELVDDSMTKYYKTIAQMFFNEREFMKTIMNTNGFCLKHYVKLLKYSNYASVLGGLYVETISKVEQRAMQTVQSDLKDFCAKHDYRNALKPLGNTENALPNARAKLYGKDYE